MKTQLTLAIRYLSGRKLRTVLTTLAIVFGVVVLFGANSLIPSLMQAFQLNVLAAADEVDATVTLKTSDAFDASVNDQISDIEGVSSVSGILNRLIGLPVDYLDADPAIQDRVTSVALLGINTSQATALHSFFIEEGRMLMEDERATALISRSLAEILEVKLGDTFALPSATGEKELLVVGILPARSTPGNEEVFVSLVQAQEMLDMAGKINAVEVVFDSLDEGVRQDIESDILTALGDQYQVGTLSTNSQLFTSMQIGVTVFNLLGVLALLMGGFIIFNTFRTVVAERRRDIGMLRTLGASRITIIGTILFEGVIQGVIGTAVGIALGYLLAVAFINMQLATPVFSIPLVIASVIIGLGVTLICCPHLAPAKLLLWRLYGPPLGQSL
jgi:putative ABC transport system permease protein